MGKDPKRRFRRAEICHRDAEPFIGVAVPQPLQPLGRFHPANGVGQCGAQTGRSGAQDGQRFLDHRQFVGPIEQRRVVRQGRIRLGQIAPAIAQRLALGRQIAQHRAQGFAAHRLGLGDRIGDRVFQCLDFLFQRGDPAGQQIDLLLQGGHLGIHPHRADDAVDAVIGDTDAPAKPKHQKRRGGQQGDGVGEPVQHHAIDRHHQHETREDQKRQPERTAPQQPDHDERVNRGEPQHLARHGIGEQHRRQRHAQQHKGDDRSPIGRFGIGEAEHQLLPPFGQHGETAAGLALQDGLTLGQAVGLPDAVIEPRKDTDDQEIDRRDGRNGQDAAWDRREKIDPQPVDQAGFARRRRRGVDEVAADEGGGMLAHLNAPSAGRRCCRRSAPLKSSARSSDRTASTSARIRSRGRIG